jgi:hypothetical protein
MRWLCFVLAVAMFPGCGTAEPQKSASVADPEDVPITEADVQMPATYSEALTRIKSCRDTIRGSIEQGAPSRAHRSLDEVDIVLRKLPSIAKDSGIAKEQWETVNLTARQLRNRFDEIHSAIDAKREPDYKAVAEPIDQAIAKLEQVLQ